MNRSIDKRRVQTVPLNTRARIAKQNTLLAELNEIHDKLVIGAHRVAAKRQGAKADNDAAWAWPNSDGARIGAALRQAISDKVTDGQANELRRGLRAVKKLKAAAAAGVLSRDDPELAALRSLVRSI